MSTKNILDVPGHLVAAYAAVTPDVYKYLDQAAQEILWEQTPDNRMATHDMHADVMKKQLPEVMRRAEHLSRYAQAWELVEAPKLAAKAEAEYKAKHTCEVCGLVSTDTQSRALPYGAWGTRYACGDCVEIAAAIWLDAKRTKARDAAVKRALGL